MPPSVPTHGHPTEIAVTQFYSRAGIGFLWNKRNDLDPGQVSIINSIYNNRKKGALQTQQTITYRLARTKAGQLGYGRYYGTKGSLETLERECRGTLCRDYYHDIDMVNAHPVLLSQFAQRLGRDLPQNDYYIANRDKVLAAISADRDEAKQEVIRILYGGTNRHEITAALSAEIRAFSKFLAAREEYAELLKAVKHEDNIYGTFLSYVLQTEERRCMMAMRECLEAAGWSVDVLAYDGVMVRKREGADLDATLRSCAAAIKAATGYDVQLLAKDFSYYELPTHDEEIAPNVTLSSYHAMRADFEANHFYYIPADQIVESRENGELVFMKYGHALQYLSAKYHFKHSDKFGDYTQFLPLWLKDPARRQAMRIDLRPSDDPLVFSPPVTLNYARYEAPHDPLPYITAFTDFLTALVPDEALRKFLIEWLAQLVQKPLENSMACVVMTGGKGCGKDTLGDFVSDWLIGRDYSHNYTSTAQFWDKHDVGRLNKLFVKLEEAVGYLNRSNEAQFKAIITSVTLCVNPKGVSPIITSNFNRFFLTTNEVAPVKLDEEERRFVIIPCGRSLRNKMDYWRTLRERLFTPAGARAVGDWLAQQAVGVFPRVLPRSDLAAEIIEEEKSAEQRFFESEEWDGNDITANDLYYIFRGWCARKGIVCCKSAQSFGMRLLHILRAGDNQLRKKKTDGGAVYYLEDPEEDEEPAPAAEQAPPPPPAAKPPPYLHLDEAEAARRATLMARRAAQVGERKQLATKAAPKTG